MLLQYKIHIHALLLVVRPQLYIAVLKLVMYNFAPRLNMRSSGRMISKTLVYDVKIAEFLNSAAFRPF